MTTTLKELRAKVTAGPYYVARNESGVAHRIDSKDRRTVANYLNYEDATFLTHSANVFEELVEALNNSRDWLEGGSVRASGKCETLDDLLVQLGKAIVRAETIQL